MASSQHHAQAPTRQAADAQDAAACGSTEPGTGHAAYIAPGIGLSQAASPEKGAWLLNGGKEILE